MTTLSRTLVLTVLAVTLSFAAVPPPPAAHAAVAEGFGAATRGGSTGGIVRVTTLADSGPGSLRAALAGGNRTVVFDVAGDVVLTKEIRIAAAFITIDGTTAPSPGITLRRHGLYLLGTDGAHDVVIRGLRVRGAAGDGIHVARGAFNVLIEGVSVQGSGDGNLDITEASDVTVAWSVLAEPAGAQKNVLIKYAPSRVTLHHNLLIGAQQRNPQVRIDDAGTPATSTTLDMRNNVVWDWTGGYGTLIWYGPRANVVRNFYASPASSDSEQRRAIQVSNGAHAYVEGNVSGDDVGDINGAGNEGGAFPAAPVTTQSACEAAVAVLGGAGVRPLDDVDRRYVAAVSLARCGSAAPAPTPASPADLVVASLGAPGSAAPGAALSVSVTTRNAGTASAGASTTRLYLSKDGAVDGGDLALGAAAVPGLGGGAVSTSTLNVTVPGTTAGGGFHLIARSDAGAVVAEGNEANNALAVPLVVAAPSGGSPATAVDLTVTDVRVPRRAAPGAAVSVDVTIRNAGTSVAPAASAAIYLAGESTLGPAAAAIGSAAVPSLAPGASARVPITGTVPAATADGRHYVIGVADPGGAVAESREDNNSRSAPLRIR